MAKVRADQLPIDQQITAAISRGFQTVLDSNTAINQEMKKAVSDMSASASLMANYLQQTAQASGSKMMPMADPAIVSPAAKSAATQRQALSQMSKPPVPDGTDDSGNRLTPPRVYDGHGGMSGLAKQTREDIRHRLADSVATKGADWTTRGDTLRMDANGRLHGPDPTGMRSGNGFFQTAKETAAYERRAVMSNMASTALKSWAGGEPIGRALMSALPQSALKFAGNAAVAVQAADKAIKFAQGQAAENRKYQEVYAGSLTDQWAERGHRWWNKNIAGRFTMLGGDNYDELFQQAMNNGLRGDARDHYIDVGAKLMGKGVNAGQTGEIMRIAMQSSQGLEGLAKAIQSVNRAARDASVSAVEARNIFIQNYKASSEVMFGSPGAAKAVAAAFTNSAVGMGVAYANRVDYSGTLSINNRLANAGTLGLTPSQYEAAVARGGGGGMVVQSESRMQDVLRSVSPDQGGTKNIEQLVTEYMKTHPNYDPRYDAKALGEYIVANGFSGFLLAKILKSQGVETDEAGAPAVAANYFTSNSPGQTLARDEAKRVQGLTGSSSIKVNRQNNDPSVYADVLGTSDEFGQAINNAYDRGANSFGVRSFEIPNVVKAMLQQQDELDIGPNSKVRVNTADGPRVVSLEQAMSQFSDQLANGSAVFMDGVADEFRGKSVAEMMALPSSVTQQAAPSSSAASDLGVSMEEWDEKHSPEGNKKGDGKGTNVTIDLKPEIKRWFSTYVDGVASEGQT